MQSNYSTCSVHDDNRNVQFCVSGSAAGFPTDEKVKCWWLIYGSGICREIRTKIRKKNPNFAGQKSERRRQVPARRRHNCSFLFFLFCAAPAQCRHNAGKLPALLQKNGCCASNSVWTEQKYSFKKPYATPAPSRYTEKRNGGSKCPLEYWKYSIIHSKSIKKLLAVCPYCVLRFFDWSWWGTQWFRQNSRPRCKIAYFTTPSPRINVGFRLVWRETGLFRNDRKC